MFLLLPQPAPQTARAAREPWSRLRGGVSTLIRRSFYRDVLSLNIPDKPCRELFFGCGQCRTADYIYGEK